MAKAPKFDPTKPFQVLDDAPAAPAAAAAPVFDPNLPFEVLDDSVPTAQKVETGARSALEGITGGASEPVISTINAMVGGLIDAGFDAESATDFVKRAVQSVSPGAEGQLKKAYEADVARRRQLEAAAPEVALPAEIGGAVLGGLAMPLAAPAQAGVAAKALTAIPRAAEAAGALAAQAVPKVLGAPVQAAVRGAAAAGSAEALKQAVQEPTGVIEPGQTDIGGAAAFGAKLGGGLGALASAARAVPDISKKLLMAFGGVDEENIAKYIKDPKAFTRAKSPEELKDMIDAQVDALTSKIDQGELSVKQAEEVLGNTRLAVRQEKFDVQRKLQEAEQAFKDRVASTVAIQEQSLSAGRLSLRDQTQEALEALKERVVQGSQQSYDILERSGRQIETAPAISAGQAALNGLKVAGQLPTVGSPAASVQRIQGHLADLKKLGKKLSASDAKRKIQQLDQDFEAIEVAGGFSDAASNAIKSMRRAFDQQLKDLPEYAQVMKQVSADSELLTEARKRFGTLEKANAKMARIEAPDRTQDRKIIQQLAQRVGMPLDIDLTQIGKLSAQLERPAIEAAAAKTPAAREIGQMRSQLEMMRRPGYAESAEQVVAAQQRVLRQQEALAEAKQALESLGPLGRPASNISAIATAVRGKNPEYVEYLRALSQMSETDFIQAIDDLRLADSFRKEFRIGSRNVNVWALGAGGAIYAMTGSPVAAAAVAGLGGGFGGLVDRFGPRMVQKILDGYIRIDGLPTVQKLNRIYSDLPRPVLEQLKNDLIRSMAVAPDEPVVVSEDQKAAVSQDVMTAKISTLEKSKLLVAIQNDEPVSTHALMRVAMGGPAGALPVKWTQ